MSCLALWIMLVLYLSTRSPISSFDLASSHPASSARGPNISPHLNASSTPTLSVATKTLEVLEDPLTADMVVRRSMACRRSLRWVQGSTIKEPTWPRLLRGIALDGPICESPPAL
eukprot:766421-Hanusia_phi.AAC.10